MDTTTDSIIDYLTRAVAERTPISPSTWVDAAAKLNVLAGEDTDRLYDLQQKISLIEVGYIDSGMTSAAAKTRARATDTYREMKQLEGKIHRIEELIRIAKLQARLRVEEAKGNI